MHCPDVTLRSIRSHLSHVASLSIYNVFYPFYVRFYHCVYTLFRFQCDMYVCYVLYYISINHVPSITFMAVHLPLPEK